jgi:hypothetical protein
MQIDKEKFADEVFRQMRAAALLPAQVLLEMAKFGNGQGGVQMADRIRNCDLIVGLDPVDLHVPPIIFVGGGPLANAIDQQIKPVRFLAVIILGDGDVEQMQKWIGILRRPATLNAKPSNN